MRALKIIIVLVITSLIGFSCESSTYEEISGEVANPTYTVHVQPIIQNNCLSCHSQVRNAAEEGNMICRIDDQSCGSVMPQSGRMPQTTINTIKNWATNGFPN
jgi:hypothetical protein